MTATPTTSLRQLDHRGNDGIDVRLLWDARTDQVSLAVARLERTRIRITHRHRGSGSGNATFYHADTYPSLG